MENKHQVKAKMFILKTRDMDLVATFHSVSIPLITKVRCESSQVTVSSWDGTERAEPNYFMQRLAGLFLVCLSSAQVLAKLSG